LSSSRWEVTRIVNRRTYKNAGQVKQFDFASE
jgi:hypothetical protein